MGSLLDFLAASWCPSLLLGIALTLLAALGRLRRRKVRGFTSLLVLGSAVAVASIGGLALLPRWGWWLLVSALAFFVCLIILLALSGAWRPALGYTVAVLALFGAGGLWLNAAGASFLEMCHDLRGLMVLHPWWLLLVLLVPLFFLLSAPRLNRSEPRPWIAVGLRSAGVICLSLALAEPQLRQPNHRVTVLFVVDRSLSIPEELVDDLGGGKKDQRERRIRDFINSAVAQRGAGHERDRAGLIVFGRWPRLELPPSDAPRFNLKEELPHADGRQLHRHRRRPETRPRLLRRRYGQTHRPHQRRQREPRQRRGTGPPCQNARRRDRRAAVGRRTDQRGRGARRARRGAAGHRAGRVACPCGCSFAVTTPTASLAG